MSGPGRCGIRTSQYAGPRTYSGSTLRLCRLRDFQCLPVLNRLFHQSSRPLICIIALFWLILLVGAADARIPRSHAALVAFAKLHPCPSTGQPIPHCPQFILDHFVPLACNGADAPKNLRWMAEDAALLKDRWERKQCAALKAIEKKNGGIAPDQDFKHPTWYVDGPHK
jgi:hypothetical protein